MKLFIRHYAGEIVPENTIIAVVTRGNKEVRFIAADGKGEAPKICYAQIFKNGHPISTFVQTVMMDIFENPISEANQFRIMKQADKILG